MAVERYARRMGDRSQIEQRIVEGGLNGMQAWMNLAAQRAKDHAPVDTGRLSREIKADPEGPIEAEPLVFSGLFGVSGLAYARAHELGSGIHALDPAARQLIPITAGYWTGKSQAKVLAFAWPGGPKDHPAFDPESGLFFFHTVYHPGVKPAHGGKGYLRLAASETHDEGRRLMILAITAALRRRQ